MRVVARAGLHRERAREWEKAIACYQKGLEVDPLSEEMYRGLISCNIRMGHAAEAHSVYRRCCKTLSAVLGANASPELKAILTSATAPPAPVRT